MNQFQDLILSVCRLNKVNDILVPGCLIHKTIIAFINSLSCRLQSFPSTIDTTVVLCHVLFLEFLCFHSQLAVSHCRSDALMAGFNQLCQVTDSVQSLQGVCLQLALMLSDRPHHFSVVLCSLGPFLLDDVNPSQTIQCRDIHPVRLFTLQNGFADELV